MTEPRIAQGPAGTEPDVDPDAIDETVEERDIPLTTDEDQQDGDLGGGGGEAGTG